MKTIGEIRLLTAQARRKIVEVDYATSEGHIGGALSCIDVLAALYHGVMTDNDLYLQSKGHCSEALYIVLAQKGFIEEAELDTYCATDSRLYGHPTNHVPGVLMNTGALGHGLSVGVGACIAKKRDGKQGRCFVLLGDGEMAEGSNFEAMTAAAHYGLDNLVAVIDRNMLQISGNTEDVLALGDMEAKARAYGWNVKSIDGHDTAQIIEALKLGEANDKPLLIISNTVKGKGASFMEGDLYWHHGVMTAEQYAQALSEIDSVIAACERGVK